MKAGAFVGSSASYLPRRRLVSYDGNRPVTNKRDTSSKRVQRKQSSPRSPDATTALSGSEYCRVFRTLKRDPFHGVGWDVLSAKVGTGHGCTNSTKHISGYFGIWNPQTAVIKIEFVKKTPKCAASEAS